MRGLEVERFVKAGFGPIQITRRLVEHTHEKKEFGCWPKASLMSFAEPQCFTVTSSVG